MENATEVNGKEEQTDTSGKSARVFQGRHVAWMVLALLTASAAAVYYYSWQDDHTVLTVNLYRDNQSQPVSYQVYKYQLQTGNFVTIDGKQVTVADSERMEIIGLDD